VKAVGGNLFDQLIFQRRSRYRTFNLSPLTLFVIVSKVAPRKNSFACFAFNLTSTAMVVGKFRVFWTFGKLLRFDRNWTFHFTLAES
jgi:hypothetical protein